MAPELTSEARVATLSPRRYLGQLCKHFQHKLPVTLDEAAGSIAFATGLCTLQAEPDVLLLRVSAADPDALLALEGVVARHLLRFALRDPPEIAWTRTA